MVAAPAIGTLVARSLAGLNPVADDDPVQEIDSFISAAAPASGCKPKKPAMNKQTKHRRRTKHHASTSQQAINPSVHPDAAGIDVGATELVVAIPPGRGLQGGVRTFQSFTSGLEAMRDWLVANRITTVALESTGNYWICAYDLLEAAGLEVFLVNARHVKGVPGKKTDVCDAQWLQQLHAAGLLRKSFRPSQEILPLRYLMRHREGLVTESSRQIQRMQKVLTELNLKIQHVFSDLDGVSAQAIIDAILKGERDPVKLARLRDRRCRSSESEIIEALQGSYREEYLFVLRQCQSAWRQLQSAIADCDEQIGALAAKVKIPSDTALPPAPHPHSRRGKNPAERAIREQAWQFYGVDLSAVPGLGANGLAVLMSEIGTRENLLKSFRSPAAFCSWMGLCPDNRISGGKVLKAKTRKVPSRLARALRLGMFGLQRAENKMAQHSRRLKGRLGKAEGLTAGAHKLARIIYGMIFDQTPYDEDNAFKATPANLARQRKHLEKQAAALGLQLTPLQ
jgi:transposase